MGGGMMFFPCLILNTEVIYAVVTSALICYMHVFLAGLFAASLLQIIFVRLSHFLLAHRDISQMKGYV